MSVISEFEGVAVSLENRNNNNKILYRDSPRRAEAQESVWSVAKTPILLQAEAFSTDRNSESNSEQTKYL